MGNTCRLIVVLLCLVLAGGPLHAQPVDPFVAGSFDFARPLMIEFLCENIESQEVKTKLVQALRRQGFEIRSDVFSYVQGGRPTWSVTAVLERVFSPRELPKIRAAIYESLVLPAEVTWRVSQVESPSDRGKLSKRSS